MACKLVFVNFLIFSAVFVSLTLALPQPSMEIVSQHSGEANDSGNAVHISSLTAARHGRQFYGGFGYPGFGGGHSAASASASAGSFGGGFPGGFGNSFANAQASSSNFGFGK